MTAGVKVCRWCGADFIQPKPPKAAMVYCKYACYTAASRDGVL